MLGQEIQLYQGKDPRVYGCSGNKKNVGKRETHTHRVPSQSMDPPFRQIHLVSLLNEIHDVEIISTIPRILTG